MNQPESLTPEAPRPAYDPVLGGVLRFSYPDLLANHAGRMTDDQRAALRQSIPARLREDAMMAGGFGFFFLLGLVAVLPGGAMVPCVGGTVILGILAALSGGLVARRWNAIQADLDGGEVSAVEGSALPGASGGMVGRYGAVHHLTVQGQRFELPKETLALFRKDTAYRVFYAPRSKIVLSAAPARVR